MQNKKRTSILEAISDKFLKLPGYVQILISWVIIIACIALFVWVNNNYIHIPFSGSDECSGTFEHNCGDIDDTRMDREYPDR
jgi:hypothetical protein